MEMKGDALRNQRTARNEAAAIRRDVRNSLRVGIDIRHMLQFARDLESEARYWGRKRRHTGD